MDWYYGRGINDFLLPEDEDLLDGAPSAYGWSKWEISQPDDLNSTETFFMVDTDATDVDFNFIDDYESFSEKIEIESSLRDKDQSSSSSVCGGLPEQSFQQTALSCDEPNYQLQDLSSFEQIDDIFLYKRNFWDYDTGFYAFKIII